MVLLIITSCSASKDDSVSILENSKIVKPEYYLHNLDLISELHKTRRQIFQDPRINAGKKVTHAFDLYINAGRAYKDLKQHNYKKTKSMLLSDNKIEWFFLSGGFGIIHALEEAKKYQATFNSTIANKNNIPFTIHFWKNLLPLICDSVVARFNPEWIYVFGSKDYTNFVKQTHFWRTRNDVKIFESTGRNGTLWLSPKLDDLVSSIINGRSSEFNKKYPRFLKQ
jgi:cytoplasmic iron level regulating protein YaaA (DUF328/UPF0246 family)